MILVVGGIASGKRTYACSLGFPEEACAFDVHELVRDVGEYGDLVETLADKRVVTCAEVGNGIVPLDPGERAYRERVGRMSSALAARADAVVRMVCGIPVVLKGCPPDCGTVPDEGDAPTAARQMFLDEKGNLMPAQAAQPPHPEPPRNPAACSLEFVLIRHGQTPGNGEKRYVGVLDQPLSDAGRVQAQAAGVYGDVGRVYVSTLRRTHETAALMFPNAEQVVVEGVQEMDFGVFAGRSPDEMVDDAQYRAWVDGECEGACPGGESQGAFTDRVCAALEELFAQAASRGEERLVMVAHGGTMMAFLDRYGGNPSKKYWEWLVGNCEGYRITLTCDEGGITVRSVERWNDARG